MAARAPQTTRLVEEMNAKEDMALSNPSCHGCCDDVDGRLVRSRANAVEESGDSLSCGMTVNIENWKLSHSHAVASIKKVV